MKLFYEFVLPNVTLLKKFNIQHFMNVILLSCFLLNLIHIVTGSHLLLRFISIKNERSCYVLPQLSEPHLPQPPCFSK